MTSTQTLTNHTSFNTKQKPLHLSDEKQHQYSSSKQINEVETLSKLVSQHNLRTSTLTRKPHYNQEQSIHPTQNLSAAPTSENSRKSASPQASSETTIQFKGKVLPSRSSTRQKNNLEEPSQEKSSQRYDTSRTRKSSEDMTTYNTRRHGKPTENTMETEDIQSNNENKKSIGEMLTNQQNGGYHLRRTGHKTGNRDTAFSDDFEYEYPNRNQAGNENSGDQSLSTRSKNQKGGVSTHDDNMNQDNGENGSQRGGSGSKNINTRRGKQHTPLSILGTEEISLKEYSTEIHEKKRSSMRITRETREIEDNHLKCTGTINR